MGRLAGGDWTHGVQLGVSWLVWGAFVRTVLVWHMTWSVNSLSHLFGYRTYDTGEDSRNNWLVALLVAAPRAIAIVPRMFPTLPDSRMIGALVGMERSWLEEMK